MFYIENKLNLSSEQLNFIEFVSSNSFPWYYQYSTSDKYMLYAHVPMIRNNEDLDKTGVINSSVYPNCLSIFNSFCVQNNISYTKIFRVSLNSTYHVPDKMVDIHTDHENEHKVFLFYMNQFDEGYTYIFDNNHNEIKVIKPELHKGVVFSGEPHSHGFCAPFQRRLVMVINFI